ncbi:MAG: RIP metalloprotease RseP [Candidatus Cloacimonetes bacterium]|nr:RIP metalloprotease RseP [Candidatus Cloacimonadota bacterium]
MLNIIGALIALGILVTVHETGHFIAARIFGVEVEKFSIGFGPKLVALRKGVTEYRISLIPLGGYVKMKGENPNEEIEDKTNSFRALVWWKRAIVAFAGPFSNLVFAILLFIVSFAVGRNYEDHLPIIGKVDSELRDFIQVGDEIIEVNEYEIEGWSQIIQHTRPDELNIIKAKRDGEEIIIETDKIEQKTWVTDILPFSPAIIGDVAPGFAAYKVGLMKNDEILSVDGKEVKDWYEMREIITGSPNETVKLKIKRDGQIFEKTIALEDNLFQKNKIIGITQHLPLKIKENYNLGESVSYGTFTTLNFVAINYSMLFKLITNPKAIKANLGGPVMIFTLSQQSVNKGLDSILTFMAAISIILMMMNLLPIPILDGGNIFFCFVEGIQKKPLSQKLQIVMQNIGIFILVFLMIFAFWNDINRIFTRSVSIQEQKVITE